MTALTENIAQLHTTSMGIERIKRNLNIDTDPVEWCRAAILSENAVIERRCKNYYATVNDAVITVNASSLTIITAHRLKE